MWLSQILLLLLVSSNALAGKAKSYLTWPNPNEFKCWDTKNRVISCADFLLGREAPAPAPKTPAPTPTRTVPDSTKAPTIIENDDEDEDDEDDGDYDEDRRLLSTPGMPQVTWPETSLIVSAPLYELSFPAPLLSTPFANSAERRELLLCRRGALECNPATVFSAEEEEEKRKFYLRANLVDNNDASFTFARPVAGDEYMAVYSVFNTLGQRAAVGRTYHVLDSACNVLIPAAPIVFATCHFPRLDEYLIFTQVKNAPLSITSAGASDLTGKDLVFYSVGDARFSAQSARRVSFPPQTWTDGLMGGAIGMDGDFCLPQFTSSASTTQPLLVERYDALACELIGGDGEHGLLLFEAKLGGATKNKKDVVVLKYAFQDSGYSVHTDTGRALLVNTPAMVGREVFQNLVWYESFHLGALLKITRPNGQDTTCVLSRSAPSKSMYEIEFAADVEVDEISAVTVSCDASDFGLITLSRLQSGVGVQVDYYITSRAQRATASKVTTFDLEELFTLPGGGSAGGSFILHDAQATLKDWSLDELLGQRLYFDAQWGSNCVVTLENRVEDTEANDEIADELNELVCEFGKRLLVFTDNDQDDVTVTAPFYNAPFLISPDPTAATDFKAVYVYSNEPVPMPGVSIKDLLGLRLDIFSTSAGFERFGRCTVQRALVAMTRGPTTSEPTRSPSRSPSTLAPTDAPTRLRETRSPTKTNKPTKVETQAGEVAESTGGSSGGALLVFVLLLLLACTCFVCLRRCRGKGKGARVGQEYSQGLGVESSSRRRNADDERTFQMELSRGLGGGGVTSRGRGPTTSTAKFTRISQDSDEEDLTSA